VSSEAKLDEDKPNMFCAIIGNVSPASKLLIKQDPDWTTHNLDTTQYPLRLVEIIVRSHLSENTGSTSLDRRAATREFTTFKQTDGENLSDYRSRLAACVARMVAINCTCA